MPETCGHVLRTPPVAAGERRRECQCGQMKSGTSSAARSTGGGVFRATGAASIAANSNAPAATVPGWCCAHFQRGRRVNPQVLTLWLLSIISIAQLFGCLPRPNHDGLPILVLGFALPVPLVGGEHVLCQSYVHADMRIFNNLAPIRGMNSSE